MSALRSPCARPRAIAVLQSATRDGAVALGFADDYGTIEAGKRADLIAVPVPPGIEDVEQYLVSGIEPEAIRWLANQEPRRTP